jgi:diguanylate cyclase (GGDEF)-like protein
LSFESSATENRFSFGQPASTPQSPDAAPEMAASALSSDCISRAMRFAKQVSYCWDIASDRISWSANTKDVLGIDPAAMATSRQFGTLLDGENFFSRYDTVLRSSQRDGGDGVAYEIEYRMRPMGRDSLVTTWIEDSGRWLAGPDGLPKEAFGVMRIANERHERDQQMNFLSNCDPLTGMMNRARMTDALGEAITVATNDRVTCAFAIVAINNLDVMNEAYGFEVADEVVVALGQRLRKVMRTGDGIARYSGSKFGIILNSCRPDELQAALERFMRAVRDSVIETKLGPVWALLSIGAVSLPALGNNPATALAHAEEALSEAFRLPSDGYVIYTTSEERKARRMLNARCATEIVSCLRDGLFKLAFQPIVKASTREVIMHEALLRMEDTTGQLITAGHLVPIAERLGLIRLIDRAVLQLGLQTLQSFLDAKLTINISATTVVDTRWNSQLLEMIAAAPEAASRLVIEITETAALDSLETSNAFVSALRKLGCGVAIDDFGAGYTSYRNLKSLEVTYIKLDGSFCRQLHLGSENRTFVQSMLDLAHAFEIKVIAEWVETEEDAIILARMGVDCLQGNLLGEASIIAPWNATAGHAFQLDAAALAPVDAAHFVKAEIEAEEVQSASKAPREASTPVFGEPIEPDVPMSHTYSPEAIETLDDAALEAEINALAEQEEVTAAEQPVEVSLEPLYETALAAQEESPEPEVEPSNFDIDDNLSKLREALAELSAAIEKKHDGEERIAS